MDNIEDFLESEQKAKGVERDDRFRGEFTQAMEEIRGSYQQLNNLLTTALNEITTRRFFKSIKTVSNQ